MLAGTAFTDHHHQPRVCQWGLVNSDDYISPPSRRFHSNSPLNSYFKWSKPHVADHGSLGGEGNGIGTMGEFHRGGVGNVTSYCRTSSAGSFSGPPTPTTNGVSPFSTVQSGLGVNPNTPLIVPHPVKPLSRTSRTYQCKVCDQIFSTKSDMLIHCQQIHKQDPKPYKCLTCSKCFSNSSYLSQHARIHSGIKPYKCEICERKFTQMSQLQQHNRTHTNERPFHCLYLGCGKAFTQLSTLKQHIRTHTNERPFRCMHLGCNKAFSQLTILQQHIRIHTNERPYHCFHLGCGKSFTQLSHLQQHIRTHTGEKPYKCIHAGCGKAFSQLSNLQSHSRSHMTDKPFRCNSCYKCYADEQSLREHIPKHSDTKHLKTHICHICGKSYTQETYLSRHMAKHQQGDGAGIGASISDFGTKTLPRHPIKQESMDGLSSEHGDPVVPFPPSAINQHCSHDRSPIDLGSPSAGRIVVDSSVRPPMREIGSPSFGRVVNGGGRGVGVMRDVRNSVGGGAMPGVPCGRGPPSAFMPQSPFTTPSTSLSNGVDPNTVAAYHHYSNDLGNGGLMSQFPHMTSMSSPRYFPYEPIAFRNPKDSGPERNLSMGMGRESMIANSLLSLQHIKNYASQQMPGFTPTCSAGSRLT